MGYLTGTIQKMPDKGKKGKIIADDGTVFAFILPTDHNGRFTVGGRARFVQGTKNIARGLKVSYSSHSRVGSP